MNRIIVGLDGTDRDREILDWVGDFAYDTGVHVIAAHFVSRAVLWMIAGAQIDSTNYLQERRDHFDGELLAPLRARIGAAHVHVQIGDPAHELAALARRSAADLIAIGAPVHTAVHDIVFGSLERRLVHESERPAVDDSVRDETPAAGMTDGGPPPDAAAGTDGGEPACWAHLVCRGVRRAGARTPRRLRGEPGTRDRRGP